MGFVKTDTLNILVVFVIIIALVYSFISVRTVVEGLSYDYRDPEKRGNIEEVPPSEKIYIDAHRNADEYERDVMVEARTKAESYRDNKVLEADDETRALLAGVSASGPGIGFVGSG